EVEHRQGERAPPNGDAVARLEGATFEELRALGLSAQTARFETLDEATDYAETQAPNLDGDIVDVVKSNLWRRQLVTAYPQSLVDSAGALWKNSRRVPEGGGSWS